MHTLQETLGIMAGILSLAGYIPYIFTTIKGQTQPNKATWFIWTLVGGLLASSYGAEGDLKAIWLPIGYFIGPLIVAILSIRYGYSIWTLLDKACVVVALISIVPWLISKNPTFTLVINVLIDSTGAIPTIVKSFQEPDTEDIHAWFIFFVANTLELLAISQWGISALYPIYLFFLAGIIVLFLLRGKLKKKVC